MFGYVIGMLCLVGLIWTLRGGRHGRGGRFRGGCGGRGFHRHDNWASWVGPGGDEGHGGYEGHGSDEGHGGHRGPGNWGYRDAAPWAAQGGRQEGQGGRHWGRREGPPWAAGGGRGWGWRGAEGMIFRRLNATSDQEHALGESFVALRSALRSAREAAGRSRGDLATALRQEPIDTTKLGDFIARFDGASMAVREALTSALFKAHEVLDERQRRELADLLEGGFFRRGGPWGQPGGDGRGDGRYERHGGDERYSGYDRHSGYGGAGGPNQAGGTGGASGSGNVGAPGKVGASGNVGTPGKVGDSGHVGAPGHASEASNVGTPGNVSGPGPTGGTEEGGAS